MSYRVLVVGSVVPGVGGTTNIGAGSMGTCRRVQEYAHYPADATLSAQDVVHKVIDNRGSSVEVSLTMPSASAITSELAASGVTMSAGDSFTMRAESVSGYGFYLLSNASVTYATGVLTCNVMGDAISLVVITKVSDTAYVMTYVSGNIASPI